jgi:hypothetical protein
VHLDGIVQVRRPPVDLRREGVALVRHPTLPFFPQLLGPFSRGLRNDGTGKQAAQQHGAGQARRANATTFSHQNFQTAGQIAYLPFICPIGGVLPQHCQPLSVLATTASDRLHRSTTS